MHPPINSRYLLSILRQARAGKSPVSVHHIGPRIIKTSLACQDPAEIEELAAIALRPPPKTTLYKYGSRSVIGKFPLQSGREVVLKFYFPKTMLKKLCYGILGSRCEKSWLGAIGFSALGIPTPSPIALLERKALFGIWNHQSFLATEVVEGPSLKAFVEQHIEDPESLKHIAEQLKSHFETMAMHRIAHGDLKASNIIVNHQQKVSFIDLDAVQFLIPKRKWQAARARDKELFHSNWKHKPIAAKIFQDVIT